MFFPYADDAPREGRLAWMNWTLIAINAAVFLAAGTRPDYDVIVRTYGFTPVLFEPRTLLTSMFLHGGLMHLLGNMWFLYLFGDNVENRCGPLKYLAAYLLAGLGGSLCQYYFFQNSPVPSIGASGAIFGVLGMYLFFFPNNRIRVFYFIFLFGGVLVVRAVWVAGLFFVMELFSSHIQTQSGVESGIGHLAHSGGFAAGVALAALYTLLGWVPDDRRHVWAQITGRAAPRSGYEEDRGADGADGGDDAPEPARYRVIREPSQPDPRQTIVALLHAGRSDEARRAWRRYAFDHHDEVLPAREQLEIALALDKNGERGIARDAYERLLARYPGQQPYAAETSLALAGMLLQEIKETGDLRELPLIESLLRQAAQTHPYEPRRQTALKWLAAIHGNA